MMRVLVACEFSAVVRDAFNAAEQWGSLPYGEGGVMPAPKAGESALRSSTGVGRVSEDADALNRIWEPKGKQ